MSHAVMLETLDTGGVWSVARGLARDVNEYKGLLMNCDLPRRNDLDGRGTLSEEPLVEFTRFFLKLPPKAGSILEAVHYRGGLPRGDAEAVAGTGERQARRIVTASIDRGVLVSKSSRAQLRLAFPAMLAARWMPGLLPKKANDLAAN